MNPAGKRRRGDRKDGIWLRDLDALHAFTPYLYPNRADNEAFIRDTIDLTAVEAYLERKNASDPEMAYKLFHVILAAVVKVVTLRPKMNRFIQGNRTYQRTELTTAFVVKKQFADEAHEALAYLSFDETATIDSIHAKILEEISNCRSEKMDNSTAGMDALSKLPRFLLRFIMWILRRLDYYGRVPYFLIRTDPNYASVFFSNLGSIRLQARVSSPVQLGNQFIICDHRRSKNASLLRAGRQCGDAENRGDRPDHRRADCRRLLLFRHHSAAEVSPAESGAAGTAGRDPCGAGAAQTEISGWKSRPRLSGRS